MSPTTRCAQPELSADMLRVVADPGVLLSALISAEGAPAQVFRRWTSGELQFVCSPLMLVEFESVGRRPRFRRWFELAEIRLVAQLLRDAAEWHEDAPSDEPAPPDPDDAYLVALTLNARADCLVTGDGALRRHRAGVRIVTPRELLVALDALESATESP